MTRLELILLDIKEAILLTAKSNIEIARTLTFMEDGSVDNKERTLHKKRKEILEEISCCMTSGAHNEHHIL